MKIPILILYFPNKIPIYSYIFHIKFPIIVPIFFWWTAFKPGVVIHGLLFIKVTLEGNLKIEDKSHMISNSVMKSSVIGSHTTGNFL